MPVYNKATTIKSNNNKKKPKHVLLKGMFGEILLYLSNLMTTGFVMISASSSY